MSTFFKQEITRPAQGRKQLIAYLNDDKQIVYLPFNLHEHPGLLAHIERFARLERVRYGTPTALFFEQLTATGAAGLLDYLSNAVRA